MEIVQDVRTAKNSFLTTNVMTNVIENYWLQ